MAMNRNFRKKKQKGQAFVETALVLPLLVLLLVGVGYFGSVITLQHNLTVAARYAARAVAIESSRIPLERTEGSFVNRLSAKMFLDYAVRSVPHLDSDRIKVEPFPLDQLAIVKTTVSQGKFEPIPTGKGFAYVYKLTGKANAYSTNLKGEQVAQLSNMGVGVGAVFYGVKVTYELKELSWMARFLFRRSNITLQASSMMPAELPLRSLLNSGVSYGLMDINNDLFKLIRTNVRNDNVAKQYQYSDLVGAD